MTEESNSPEKPAFFSIFNRDALIKSNQTPFLPNKVTINPSSHLLNENWAAQTINIPKEPISKKRGSKKHSKSSKDLGAPSVTIKEIIENDKAGIPTQTERKVQEERIKTLRESRGRKKKGLATVDTEDNTDLLHQTHASKAVKELEEDQQQDIYVPGTVMIKDGKIVLEQNLSVLPTVSDKIHELTVKKPKTLTSMSFRQKISSKKWTEEENKKFYKLLKIFGPDFSMISKLFENRSRDEIKNKYLREEKQNPGKIDESFRKNKKYNVHYLTGSFAKPKQITSGEHHESSHTREIAVHHQTNNHEEDEFTKKPGMSNGISAASIDSMDYRILGDIKKLLNDEIALSRSASQITATDLVKQPGLEKGASVRSNDVETIPAIGRESSISPSELKMQKIENTSTADISRGDSQPAQVQKPSVKSSSNDESQGPKNLFFS